MTELDLPPSTGRHAVLDRMVADVANELNNALASILTMTDALEAERPSAPVRESLRLFRGEASRAARLVSDLCALGRTRAPVFDELGLNGVVRKALSLLKADIASFEGAVDFAPEERLPSVLGDYHQILRVVVEILQNALLAASGREERRILIATSASGNRARLVIEHAGSADDALDAGPARGIIEHHGGSIRITPLDGRVRCELLLPLHAANAPHPTAPVVSPTSGLHILVVDDEAPFRVSVARFLRSRGNTVMTAVSGKEALAMLPSAPFDLVIVDHAMPAMGGEEFIGAARTAMGDACPPCLLMSGHLPDEVAAPDRAYLKKPFAENELWQAIASATGKGKDRRTR